MLYFFTYFYGSINIYILLSDCTNEGEDRSKISRYKVPCKNYTSGQPTIVVGDSSGRLGNHIWAYAFILAIKVNKISIYVWIM